MAPHIFALSVTPLSSLNVQQQVHDVLDCKKLQGAVQLAAPDPLDSLVKARVGGVL